MFPIARPMNKGKVGAGVNLEQNIDIDKEILKITISIENIDIDIDILKISILISI